MAESEIVTTPDTPDCPDPESTTDTEPLTSSESEKGNKKGKKDTTPKLETIPVVADAPISVIRKPDQNDPPQNEFFTKICEGDIVRVKQLLSSKEASVTDLDSHSMTPLEHAAYRGNKEMCQLLLDMGASVNEGRHSNGYTALHFAALSGKEQVCLLLLEKGAKAYPTNSVGRTAAQMAAFVGNHKCVSTINTFIPREDVEYHTVPHGVSTTERLPRELVSAVYALVMQVNFHPVRVAMTIRKNEALLGNLPEIMDVFTLMAAREIKKGSETNEIASFKLHLISHILRQLQKESSGAKDGDPIENFIKKMIKCREPGGIPEKLDVLLREGVRAFPFVDTTIMQQLVTSLTHTKLCEEPGAWGIVCSTINGQKAFRDNDPCATCGEEERAKKCSRCHFDSYCDKECQRLHWVVHKKYCKTKEMEYEMQKIENEKVKIKMASDEDKKIENGTVEISEPSDSTLTDAKNDIVEPAPVEAPADTAEVELVEPTDDTTAPSN